MSLDIKKITNEMLEAMKVAVGGHIDEVKRLANDELRGFTNRTVGLAEKVASGEITPEQAKVILEIRKRSLETVLLAIKGIGKLTAQDAINAALGVLRKSINAAIPGVNIL